MIKLPAKIRIGLIIIGFIILAALAILNFNYFKTLISDFIEGRLVTWGYLGFFVFVFLLESLPQPFLSALVLLLTGTLLGFNFIWLFWLALLSATFANYIAYFIGRSLGDSAVNLVISQENYQRSLVWFNRYGKKAITLLALTPLPYFPVLGGLFKMTPYEFTKYAIIPRLLHFVIFSGIIFLFM